MFKCKPDLFQQEIEFDEEAKLELLQAAHRFKREVMIKSLDEQDIDELKMLKNQVRVNELTRLHFNNPDLMEYTERVYEMMQNKNGRAVLNILLASAEKYYRGSYGSLKIGKTNYERNMIYGNDLTVEAIRQMLIMTLGKQEEEKEVNE